MIVCVCNNVSDKQIRHAMHEGLATMADLRTHLDVGTTCGKCAGCARKILREGTPPCGGVHVLLQKLNFQPSAMAV